MLNTPDWELTQFTVPGSLSKQQHSPAIAVEGYFIAACGRFYLSTANDPALGRASSPQLGSIRPLWFRLVNTVTEASTNYNFIVHIEKHVISDDKRSTRRNVLKGTSSASLALLGTGVASAESPNQSSKETEAQFIQESSNKPILKHIVEEHGMHDEITLVTVRADSNGDISKADEATINLENIDSVLQARNNESIVQKVPKHLRSSTNTLDTGTTTENDVSLLSHSSGHDTNHTYYKESAFGNIQWKLTLYSTWNWDEEERVLASPYQFTYGYSTGSPYD